MEDVKFPKSIKVGGHIYPVEYPVKFEQDGSSSTGSYGDMCGVIRIGSKYKNEERSVQQIKSTFLHEILHAIDHIYNGYEIGNMKEGEFVIELLEVVVFQVLVDNEFYIKEADRLPDKVKIGGYNFEVIFPYVFQEEPTRRYQASSEHQRIFLPGNAGYGKHSSSFTKQILLEAIVRIIFELYSFGGMYKANAYSRNLSEGLYQVLADNNLEGFFRDV